LLLMSANQPGRDENMTEDMDSSATEEEMNNRNIEETQERSDALAATPDNPTNEPLDSPVENINTDADLTPEDAGEISGGPEHAPDSTESNAPADVASGEASAETQASAP